MNVSTIIKRLLKALLIPFVTVLVLSRFNIFGYITFIPEDYRYEAGLTAYLALIEALYGFGEKYIDSKKAKIVCIFFKSETDRNGVNIPTVICDENMGVAVIQCDIKLTGNLGRLRRCELQMGLPSWISAQINASDEVLSYTENLLIWDFSRILPETGVSNQNVRHASRISLIRNTSENNISIKLQPQMKKKIRRISLETNGFTVQNGVLINTDDHN